MGGGYEPLRSSGEGYPNFSGSTTKMCVRRLQLNKTKLLLLAVQAVRRTGTCGAE